MKLTLHDHHYEKLITIIIKTYASEQFKEFSCFDSNVFESTNSSKYQLIKHYNLQLKIQISFVLLVKVNMEIQPQSQQVALKILNHFTTSYLSEKGFSSIVTLKTKYKDRLLSLENKADFFALKMLNPFAYGNTENSIQESSVIA